MRTITLFTLILIGFFGVITAIARPDVIQKKYAEIRAPIDQFFAEKNAHIWADAKELERSKWLIKLRLPVDCGAPKTAMREIECSNIMKLHMQAFEQNWANKVSTGWKPDGATN